MANAGCNPGTSLLQLELLHGGYEHMGALYKGTNGRRGASFGAWRGWLPAATGI